MHLAIQQRAGPLFPDPVRLPTAAVNVTVTRRPLAPLLEEKRNVGRIALIAQASRPGRMNRPSALPALAASDDPINLLARRLGRQLREQTAASWMPQGWLKM